MILVTTFLFALYFVAAFGFLALAIGLLVFGLWRVATGQYLTAVCCFLGVLACPAYHYYDVHRGERLGGPFAEPQIVRSANSHEPKVIVSGDGRFCGHFCLEAVARGYGPLIQVEARPRGSGQGQSIFEHQFINDNRCLGESRPNEPIQRLDNHSRDKCVIGYPVSLPSRSYTRITFDTSPFPRVKEAGFPVLSSTSFQGTYYLIIERVTGDHVELLAQSFRQVRQPMPLFYGLQYLAPESAALRQIVGAGVDHYEVLNKVMGWSLQRRLPSPDRKVAPDIFVPRNPTTQDCDAKTKPFSCDTKPPPKS